MYKNKQKGLIWIMQLVSVCMICLWLVNPTSYNIYELMGLTILWLIFTIILYRTKFFTLYNRIAMMKMFIWPSLLFFFVLFDHCEYSLTYLMYLFVFGIGLFYYEVEDRKSSFVVVGLVTVYFVIISINTLVAYSIRPNISRLLAYGDPEMIIKQGGGSFLTPFIGGYGFIYGLVFFITYLYNFGRGINWKYRLVWIVVCILFCVVLLRSQYFIAILLLIISFALSHIQRSSGRRKIGLCITYSTSIIMLVAVAPPILNSLANINGLGFNNSLRLKELSLFFSGGGIEGTDIASRGGTYMISINSFLTHPLFGTGNLEEVALQYGEHSTILDAFAQYGIIGAVPYIVFYTAPLKQLFTKCSLGNRKILTIVYILLFLLALFNRANTRANFAVLYIILPMMIVIKECNSEIINNT